MDNDKEVRMKGKRRVWLWGLGITVLVPAVLTGGMLASLNVEITEGGAHSRINVPLPLADSQGIAIHAYGGTAETDARFTGWLDGPIVRRGPEGRWRARWFCEGRVEERDGAGESLDVPCAGTTHRIALRAPPMLPDVLPMPAKVAVLSDLEGNAAFLDEALPRMGIVNAEGRWAFGIGHLVVLGDVVDRGRDVHAVLWTLYLLAGEAADAGGALHLVLGNHEQYVLAANISRAHPDHRHALQALGGYAEPFARDTVLGDWLRSRPVALQLGEVLFVHGGISPAVLDRGLSVNALNAASRAYWSGANATPTPALDSVFLPDGVTQYRGLLQAVEGRYAQADAAHVERVLAHFGVRQLVIAHTPVPRAQARYDGAVMAVNVNDNSATPSVLRYEGETPRVEDIGVPRRLVDNPSVHARPLDLTSDADRALLKRTMVAMQDLAALPQPY
jgi:hypothetical protein